MQTLQTLKNFTIKRINKGLKLNKPTIMAIDDFTIKIINKGLKQFYHLNN